MSKMSNTECRAVIKFFIRKGLSAIEITKELTDVYGDSAPSCRTVEKWVAELKDPTQVFRDAPRNGRPPTVMTNESIRAVEEVVMRDRQISVRRIADELGISKTSFYEIMNDYLGMKKVCTRWVPKLFTSLQRTNRADCYEELLENCKQDSVGFFDRIMMRVEMWIHHYDPLSQQEAETWTKSGKQTSIRPRVT